MEQDVVEETEPDHAEFWLSPMQSEEKESPACLGTSAILYILGSSKATTTKGYLMIYSYLNLIHWK